MSWIWFLVAFLVLATAGFALLRVSRRFFSLTILGCGCLGWIVWDAARGVTLLAANWAIPILVFLLLVLLAWRFSLSVRKG